MVFQTLLQGFLGLPHFWIILILALITTFVTTIIYKYATDQKKLKQIKAEIKKLRQEQKKHKKDQKKVMSIQKEMMTHNMDMMKQSFKSMLYTFIPLILLFTWMSANIAYEPLIPGEEFPITARISNSYPYELKDVNLTIIPETNNTIIERNEGYVPSKESRKEIQWRVKIPEKGTYTAIIESPTFKENKEILLTTEKDYINPTKSISQSQLTLIEIGNEPVRPLKNLGVLGRLNWLWTYILLSVILSISIRKLLKVS